MDFRPIVAPSIRELFIQQVEGGDSVRAAEARRPAAHGAGAGRHHAHQQNRGP